MTAADPLLAREAGAVNLNTIIMQMMAADPGVVQARPWRVELVDATKLPVHADRQKNEGF